MERHSATRYHDFSAGHRVCEHESKCKNLHGHNYRVHFTIGSDDLDALGRVVDFSVIKETLCEWLERHWDHRFLMYEHDRLLAPMLDLRIPGIIAVPFNPTAENMAKYLVQVVGPQLLTGTGTRLITCTVSETRKCSATYEVL